MHVMSAKPFQVTYIRTDGRRWVASVKGMPDLEAHGRSLEETKRRIEAALPKGAKLADDVQLPSKALESIASLAAAREAEEKARRDAHVAAVATTAVLTECGLGRRDVAALTGFSFQRIQQLVRGR